MNWKPITLSLACALIAGIALAGCNLPTSKMAQPTATAETAPAPPPTLPVTVIPVQQPTAAASPLPTLPPTAAATLPAAAPTTTTTPLPIPSPTATPSSTSYTPFKASVTVDAVKLRTGPGTLYPALNLLPKGESLTVYGRTPGNEWIYVETTKGGHGWVFAQLLAPEKDINNAPEVEPGNSLVVRGKVADKSGNPINGIQFALTQGIGSSPKRTDAVTDDKGVFTAYLPGTESGTWTVSWTAISCTSRVMDKNCNYQGGGSVKISPASQQFTFPISQDLLFTLE